MEWLNHILPLPTDIQAVIIICLICAVGLMLGKIHVRGFSLGVTFVFFCGILAGSLGLTIDHSMLTYAESFGLVLFVYALGLQVGPGFVSSFRQGGTTLNLLAIGVILLGTLIALLAVGLTGVSLPDMMGVLCGATTNTPALGAAQQTLQQMHLPSAGAALSCAVTYPLGLIGVILAIVIMKPLLYKRQSPAADLHNDDEAFICSYQICNPAIYGKSLNNLTGLNSKQFVVSRLWRNGKVILPDATTSLQEGDRLLVITKQKYADQLTVYFGSRDKTDWNKNDIDWNKLDHRLVSQRIIITRPGINGHKLGDLHLRNRYGVTVSRVLRSGIHLVASPSLILCMGDRVTLVGEQQNIKRAAAELGNSVKSLDEPNLMTIFIGIVLGLTFGFIPLHIPGMSFPVRLGLAGGPIIMGILIGAYGPRFHMVTYTTNSSNLMLRSLGLSIYLACLGLDAGADFLATVMRPAALIWIAVAMVITLLPVIIMGAVSVLFSKQSFSATCGMVCGAMANPIALNYANDTLPGDEASVSYATVYPLCMFARVILAQLIVMFFA